MTVFSEKLFEMKLLSYLITGSASLYALQASRIFPLTLPETSTLPATTYQKIPGGAHTTYHAGLSGYEESRYQFNIWAADKLTARNTADALIWTLGRWTGTASYVNDDFDRYEPTTKLFGVVIDVEFGKSNLF